MIKQLIKKQRGITLSMLLITIILVSILIGVTVVNLDMGNDIKEYNYMCADIELLDSKVLMYYNENKSLPVSSNEQIDVTHISEKNPKDNGKYYELDLSKLSNVSLNLGKGNKENKDIYIINEQSYTVYYLKGVKYEGTTYHRPIKKTTEGSEEPPIETLLPSEYQQVEYLESSGTQYIDTEVQSVAGLVIESELQSLNNNIYMIPFGLNGGINMKFSNGYIGFDSSNYINQKVNEGEICNVIVEQEETQKTLSWNGYNITGTSSNKSGNVFLFGLNDNGKLYQGAGTSTNVSSAFYGRMGRTKMYLSGTLVRDFIPCYKKEGNVPGMYDIVNDIFYENKGTGTFVVGADVENEVTPPEEEIPPEKTLPSEYQQVEYIESTGTQYIDTGYVNSEDTKPYKIEAEFQYTEMPTSSSTFVFGTSRDTGNVKASVFGIDPTQNAWMFGHYGSSGSSVRFGTPDTNRHKVKYVFGEGLYLDDVLESTTVTQASTSSNSGKNIGLFARIRGTEPNGYASMRLYSCKFYEANDVLVRDFIPCYRKSDNVAGLYDLVNDVFYTNAGTGTFNIGGNV